jgi:glycosyltransferase involved in cell wall biosynthesis
MRIGLDMLAVQSPHHAHRGIGRYARDLAIALSAVANEHELIYYIHQDLRKDLLPAVPADAVREIAPDETRGEWTITPRMDRLVRENPDELDTFLVLSPIEHWNNFVLPAKPRRGPLMASVVYDLIPLRFQDEPNGGRPSRTYLRSIAELRRYDLLLAISEATRRDCVETLAMRDRQVVNIRGACDTEKFTPEMPPRAVIDDTLRRLNIDRPFVFYVGGMDVRKNVWGLIDAFALLPETIRNTHQLVVTCDISYWDRGHLFDHAKRQGVEDCLVVTGGIDDDDLLVLYKSCATFAFPSFFEGFGLPILEAMRCGAPVIASNNSSQPEVVGDAGLLVNATDSNDIAEKIAKVVTDPELAAEMRRKSLLQADEFSWRDSAGRALNALVEHVAERTPVRPHRLRSVERKRLAFFSPMPPEKSGVADYAYNLFKELRNHYAIDVFHHESYTPDVTWTGEAESVASVAMFERLMSVRNYRGHLYQMGNSRYHQYLYSLMLLRPGVTTLHDFCLAGFHLWRGHAMGRPREYFAEQLARSTSPENAAELSALLKRHADEPEKVISACARQGAYMNREIFEKSHRVVVHSPWCIDRLAESAPEQLNKATVIVHGATPGRFTPTELVAIRSRFGVPQDALVVSAFGFIHPDKMSGESLIAFRSLAQRDPKALYLFVGQETDDGYTRRTVAELNLQTRVRFLGRQSWDDFANLAAITDVGFNLRRPPTNGETSGALLNLLRWGVPTIVTDVGTFSDYPDSVVRKVAWEKDGQTGLNRALDELAGNRQARENLGGFAWEHVQNLHDWPRVAEQYMEVIEQCHAERRTAAA